MADFGVETSDMGYDCAHKYLLFFFCRRLFGNFGESLFTINTQLSTSAIEHQNHVKWDVVLVTVLVSLLICSLSPRISWCCLLFLFANQNHNRSTSSFQLFSLLHRLFFVFTNIKHRACVVYFQFQKDEKKVSPCFLWNSFVWVSLLSVNDILNAALNEYRIKANISLIWHILPTKTWIICGLDLSFRFTEIAQNANFNFHEKIQVEMKNKFHCFCLQWQRCGWRTDDGIEKKNTLCGGG